MTLQAPKLDDLTWEDLRLLALRKIPAASGGRWTHHAPVDSGITLLEIFAFLLEQQLFVLDQVPDSLIRAILGLAILATEFVWAETLLHRVKDGGKRGLELTKSMVNGRKKAPASSPEN